MKNVLLKAFVLFAMLLATCNPISSLEQGRTPLVQSVDVLIPLPPTPVTIAGLKYLGYELHITNFRPFDVALTRVEVLDADRKTRLAEYSESELAARIGRPGISEIKDKRQIAGGMRAVVYLWIPLDQTIPSHLQHRIECEFIRPAGRERIVVEPGAIEVRMDSPVVLDAPLRGGLWAALYDPSMERGHRTSIYTIQGRARIPARFAIDWIRLDSDAKHARGDESKIANWYGYGAEVLAVSEAVVADARDDIAESESISESQGPIPLENASGNYITLDLSNGRYAFYEHLKHGSIRVKRGDRVKTGQVIGLLGNSGSSSSGPHLHFHVSDANSALAAEGIPFVFKRFEIVGAFDSIDAYSKGEKWNPLPHSRTRIMEMPAPNVVVTFP